MAKLVSQFTVTVEYEDIEEIISLEKVNSYSNEEKADMTADTLYQDFWYGDPEVKVSVTDYTDSIIE